MGGQVYSEFRGPYAKGFKGAKRPGGGGGYQKSPTTMPFDCPGHFFCFMKYEKKNCANDELCLASIKFVLNCVGIGFHEGFLTSLHRIRKGRPFPPPCCCAFPTMAIPNATSACPVAVAHLWMCTDGTQGGDKSLFTHCIWLAFNRSCYFFEGTRQGPKHIHF